MAAIVIALVTALFAQVVCAAVNLSPTVALTAPVSGAVVPVSSATTLTATATDADGTVVSVQFLVNSVSIGTVTAAPYAVSWTPASTGNYSVTAIATDDLGATATTAAVSVTATTQPIFSSFSPGVLGSGVPVTITGANFTGVTAVKFNNVNATSFTVDSLTQITAIVPSGVTAGAVSVTTGTGTATSGTNYTTTSSPIITAISPTSGPVGRVVTIYGGNFGTISNSSSPQVSFNGVTATAQRQSVPGGFRVVVPTGATTGPITVTVSGVGSVASSTFTVLTGGTAPANDDFANAQVISGATGVVTGNNAFATKQTGEPSHGTTGGTSVWFSWVAPSSGAFLFDQTGSEFGAYVAVYTGTAVSALTQVVTGDQPNSFTFNYSPAAFLAQAGVTYYLAVDGFSATSGALKLSWSPLAAPTITSFTPTSAYAGQSVTIQGSGFTPRATVTVAGVTAVALLTSATTMTISQVPSVTTAGPVVVTTVAGTATSAANFTVPAVPTGGGRALANESVLGNVGASPILANFSVEGSVAKTVLVRAAGPKLGDFGLAGFLADPKLEVYDGQGVLIAQNDDWGGGTTLSSAFSSVGAFPFVSGSKDAAALVTANPGTYTVKVSGVGGATGSALIEIYDTDSVLRIPYLSFRRPLAFSGDTIIAGIFVSGSAPQRLLIRGIGPALVASGVSGTLGNPAVALLGNSGALLASNENWGTAASQPTLVAATTSAGLIPLVDGSNDAAMLVDIAPGSYTVRLSGTGGTTGTGLIEIAQIDSARAASFAPALIVPPQPATFVAGGSVTLGATAVGSPQPTYQWRKAGVAISGATNSSYAASVAGAYSVVMSNTAGTTTSADYIVTSFAAGADAFANATVLTGATTTSTANNVAATKESGEPNHAGDAGGKSVWWTWTAPANGRVTIETTGSAFTTLLGVYTGTSPGALAPVASSNGFSGSGTSKVTFDAVAGTTYKIAVDGYGGASGDIMLGLGYSYVFSTYAGETGYGNSDGPAGLARFDHPWSVAVDGSGNLFVADTANHTIRKIAPDGSVTTYAGTAGVSGSADGTGAFARFKSPQGVAVDASGNVYVGDAGNYTVRKIAPGGVVSTLAGGVGLNGSTDATGLDARFNAPFGVAVDGSGNVYVADVFNNTIRKINGVTRGVTTLAGTAGSSGSTDATGAVARFSYPAGVAVDGGGNVYVADLANNTIRKVTAGGVVTTLAGLAQSNGSVDGTAGAARFGPSYGVAVDAGGDRLRRRHI